MGCTASRQPDLFALASSAESIDGLKAALSDAPLRRAIDNKDDKQWTALNHAVHAGNLGGVEALLKCGASVATRSSVGSTPLHFACLYGHEDIAALLISEGADIRATCNGGGMALDCACSGGHLAIVNLLLDKGADINYSDHDLMTPLHCACESGVLPLCELLLQMGADPQICNAEGKTPLECLEDAQARASMKELFKQAVSNKA